MNDIDRIEVGDSVRIDINGSQGIVTNNAWVVGIRFAPGDSWDVRDKVTGKLICISEGCTVTLLEKGVKK